MQQRHKLIMSISVKKAISQANIMVNIPVVIVMILFPGMAF